MFEFIEDKELREKAYQNWVPQPSFELARAAHETLSPEEEAEFIKLCFKIRDRKLGLAENEHEVYCTGESYSG